MDGPSLLHSPKPVVITKKLDPGNTTAETMDRKGESLTISEGNIQMHTKRSKIGGKESRLPPAVEMVYQKGPLSFEQEIKANRVQLNTRTSTEMRITNEKLYRVILEDVSLPITTKLSDTLAADTETKTQLCSWPREHANRGLCDKPSDHPPLEPTNFFVTQCDIIPQENALPLKLEEHPQSSLPFFNMGSSFFFTAFSDRLNLAVITSSSIKSTPALNFSEQMLTGEQPAADIFPLFESNVAKISDTKLVSSLEYTYKYDTSPEALSHKPHLETREKPKSKLLTKNLTSEISNRRYIQRGFLGNLRVDSNIKITTTTTTTPQTVGSPKKNALIKIGTDTECGSARLQPQHASSYSPKGKPTLRSDERDESGVVESVPSQRTVALMLTNLNNTRRMLLHSFSYQIVNATAAKHRYIFLFDDILLVTKPIGIEKKQSPGLHSRFLVKHCIATEAIQFNGARNDVSKKILCPPRRRETNTVFLTAVRKFESSPWDAIQYLVDRGLLNMKPSSVAGFLHKTPGLSKKQIGRFLGMKSNQAILTAFLDRCRLTGLRIDDALRVFLGSFRLPGDGSAIDHLVKTFTKHWHKLNQKRVQFESEITIKLTFYMMALNAELHGKESSSRNILELPEFVTRFQESNDVNLSELLGEVYASIQQDKLEIAAEDNPSMLAILIQYPECHQLSVDEWTDIIVEIPAPEEGLRIKPVGDGLISIPEILDFTHTNQQALRLRFNSPGRKWLTLIKLGSHARNYNNIPKSLFIIEPCYMRNSILLTFPTDDTEKKFLYGFEDQAICDLWAKNLSGIEPSRGNSLKSPKAAISNHSIWTGYDLLKHLVN